MRFDLIRLVLVARPPDLFSGDAPDREVWLREVFGGTISFRHYRSEMHYVPSPTTHPTLIVGRIGKATHVEENEPPEAGMGDIERESWIAADVLIDPVKHADGQKAAVQDRVGKPSAIFKSLVRHINETGMHPYVIEANPIVDPSTFWEFEAENRGEITSITFDLFPPNMFGIRSELDKEMKDLQKEERVHEATLQLKNPDGLDLNTERTKQTVEYTLEGGGNIRAKTKRKRTYNSKNRNKRVQVEADQKENFLNRIGKAIARLFE